MIVLGSCSDDAVAAALQANPELADRLRTAMPKAKAPPPQVLAEMAAAQVPIAQVCPYRPRCKSRSNCTAQPIGMMQVPAPPPQAQAMPANC